VRADGAGHDELFLIDGNSLAYRAFFALPESIATSTGVPTNAIFGFASMLVKILTEYGPRATIVAWDAGHSGRKEIYADYKAQRSSRPDLLKQQWPALAPLVEAFGYANVSVEGQEADDVIATLAERAKAAGIPVMVVTGDRDAYQLVDGERVRIMTTSRGITDTKVYDRQEVIDRYGIPPELVPDFIGLKGDTSDNIPGVPGIGDKTAAQLLQEHGSLEEVLAHAHEIRAAKRRENLLNHADDARISKRLATMDRALGVELDVAAFASAEPDRSRLREVFREYELRDPLRRLEEALGDSEEAAPRPEAEQALRARVRGGAAPDDVAGLPAADGTDEVALAARPPEKPEDALFGESEAWRFGAYAGGEEALAGECAAPDELAAALGARPALAHDAKALGTVPRQLAFDTLIAAYLLDPARRAYALDELCEERGIGVDPSVQDAAAREAMLVHALAAAQRPQIEERGLVELLCDVELPLVRVLREMEQVGLKLDKQRLAAIRTRVNDEVAKLEREIWEQCGTEFMIGSPQQLAEVLFVKLGLSRKRRGKTGYSTDARVLQAIRHEHPVIEKIERWRELTKLESTYLAALPAYADAHDRIHTTFSQVVAATGRLSSNDPNLQNIPIRTPLGREIRACFIAEPGNALLSIDYSQVELRILAHIAGEEVLKEIFRRGEDVHTATASTILRTPPEQLDAGSRSKAKMVNYGIVYGLSAFGLSDRLGISREEAQEFIDRYLEGFPAVKQFIATTIEQATEHGYVTTLMGRRRQIPELRARNRQVRQLGERLAVNTVIQGTAADVMKVAMVRTDAALRDAGLATRLVLQIHDELLFEGPRDELPRAQELVVPAMVGALELDPPLAVDAGIGPNWLEAK